MQPLYDAIGETYTSTRRADPRITAEIGRHLGFRSNGRYLDLACGTGNYTRALAAAGGLWHGADISEVMLAQARAKPSTVAWTRADTAALPFEDGSFDGVVCTLAVHHFGDLTAAFREVRRVLAGGRFVIFTGLPDQMAGYWLCHYFPTMLERSIAAMPSRERYAAALASAGFARHAVIPFKVTTDLEDLFLYAGKQRPELYLRADVRANISSFAALADADEVDRGLAALKADIDSGRFASIARRYDHDGGDYAFIVAAAE